MTMDKSGADISVCDGCGLILEWDWEKNQWVHALSRTPACDEVQVPE